VLATVVNVSALHHHTLGAAARLRILVHALLADGTAVSGERAAGRIVAYSLILLPDLPDKVEEGLLNLVLCLGRSLDVLSAKLGSKSVSLCKRSFVRVKSFVSLED